MDSDLWWVETKGGTRKKPGAPTIRSVKQQLPMARLLKHYGGPYFLDQNWLQSTYDGGWVAIKCPFHPDSKPSASFNQADNRFRCHVCDIGGDVVDVVMDVEDLTTKEALKWIQQNLL